MLVLLGASTGGPAAVKEFIDALPHQPLPACFVLANHITQDFLSNLQDMLNEHPNIDAEIIDGRKPIQGGKLYIAPVDRKIAFSNSGYLELLNEEWSKPYAPNINDVFNASLELNDIETLAIVFSGMDDDGTQSADALADKGVEIWCQSIESCVQSSMPESIIKTGKVIYKDDPQGLARQLADLLEMVYPIDQYA
ncbi:MAG: chemotaxis protein CheB [Kangiellaceae bacterium]|nr:chemotaxis protein CheB [Kangiellaceae bacterium]